jgi:NNP family nitrate/nitrite transporter-like MFS transporter
MTKINHKSNHAVSPDGENEKASSFLSQSGPLLFLALIFFLNFMARIILAPLMPAMKIDLGVGHGEAGSLFLLISLGYFITLLGAGFFSSRLSHRRTIVLSSTAVGMALIGVSFTSSLWGIRLGFFFVGMAAGIYIPSGIATLTSLITSRHWGKALAIHELAPNLSFVAAPLISELLLGWFSWRGVLAILGGSSVLAGIAFARFGKGGEFQGETPSLSAFRTLFREPAFWIMVVLFSLGIGGTLGIFTMLPLYLVSERGIDRNWANTLIALSRISAVGIVFLAGWTTDRFGPKGTMSGVLLLTGLMTVLLGAGPDSWIVVLVFLQPTLAACFFPPGFSALSSIGPPEVRSLAVSLAIPFAFLLGAGALPMGMGAMGDAMSFSLGISLVGGIILLGFILPFFLKFPDENKIT